jgi:hypothetical protein
VTPTDTRCPDCGSLVRAGMSWCTLCHADLRSEEEKEAARLEPSLLLVPGGADDLALTQSALTQSALAQSALAQSVPTRGRHARPSPTPAAELPLALVAAPGTAADPDGPAAESEAKLAELREAGIDVEGMLQMLAADKGSDPLTGFVKERLGSKGSRAIAILLASAALTSLGILLMFVLGSIFG